MAKVMKSTDSSSLAEVVDRILDKGIVIDVWAKVSLVGIELLSIEARGGVGGGARSPGGSRTAQLDAASRSPPDRISTGRIDKERRREPMNTHFSSFTPEAMQAFGRQLATDST